MMHRNPSNGLTAGWMGLLVGFGVAALWLVSAAPAWGQCRPKHKRKVQRYIKGAQDDFDMLEIKSALRKLQRAIEYAEDHDCDTTTEYAKALLRKGIYHWRGEQDIGRCKVYMRKAIKANACVSIDRNMPPKVQRIWRQVRAKYSHYKCRSGGGGNNGGGGGTGEPGTPPERRRTVTPPPPRRRVVDFGEPPTKPCEHTSIDEVEGASPIRVIVKVQSILNAGKVVVFYRPQGEASYKKLLLKKAENGWAWTGLIPSIDVHGQRLAYFIEVQNAGGTAICSPLRATSGQPEIIMVKPPKRRASSDCTEELPEEVCQANPDNPCCKKGHGKTPAEHHKPSKPRGFPSFYLQLGFSMGVGYLTANMKSDINNTSPHVPGFALGPVGGQAELGYFLGASHLLSVHGRFGVSFSDVSETTVISWVASLRYRFFILGGGKTDLFSLYVGGEVGGAQIYDSLAVGNNNQKDTFGHGFVLVGALVGVLIGTQRVAWYIDVDPLVVFPAQTTFHLDFSTGVALRF